MTFISKLFSTAMAALIVAGTAACSDDERTKNTLDARAVITEIGPPPRHAAIRQSNNFEGDVSRYEWSRVDYLHDFDKVESIIWLDEVQKRLDCTKSHRSDIRSSGRYSTWLKLRCNVVRNNHEFVVHISVPLEPGRPGDTTVIVQS